MKECCEANILVLLGKEQRWDMTVLKIEVERRIEKQYLIREDMAW
jgi:hypothetical protein